MYFPPLVPGTMLYVCIFDIDIMAAQAAAAAMPAAPPIQIFLILGGGEVNINV